MPDKTAEANAHCRYMRIFKKILIFIISAVLLVTLSGCRTVEVARDLDQFQANKVIARLNSLGISAQSEVSKGSKGRYTLLVNQSDRLAAISLIDKLGLISKPDTEFDELTKSQGFLPSSRAVENLRLDRALAAELEEILNSLPQTVNSNVIVRLNYLPAETLPSVSVVLEVKAVAESEEIRQLIMNSVPGVATENIIVTIKEAEDSDNSFKLIGLKQDGQEVLPVALVPFFIWLVPEGVDYELALLVLALALMAIILGGMLGFAFGRKKIRKTNNTLLPEAAAEALEIDSNVSQDQGRIS